MKSPVWIACGLLKASDEPWTVYLQASDEVRDHDGELIRQSAFREAWPYHQTHGQLTYEHMTTGNRNDPSILIGQPLEARFPADGRTLVKYRLYEHQPKAQAVWNIARSGGALKASAGGGVLDPGYQRGQEAPIRQIWWNHTAITPWPVNEATGVQLTPFPEFLKALGATTGTSAQPLVMQDVEGARERLTPAFQQRWHALTEIIARTQGKALEEARQMALGLLITRGEAREAFVTLGG